MTSPRRFNPLNALRSLRLTVALLAAGAGYAAAASFTGLSFTHPLFLGILVLFGLNLAACTSHRLVYHPHRRVRDYMADGIHIGLLVLLVGGAGSLLTREERQLVMSPGDRFSLGGQWQLTLTETERLPDNWVSRFSIVNLDEGSRRVDETRVNAPLRLDGYSLFQTAWEQVPVLEMVYEDGRQYTMAENEGFQVDGDLFVFERVQPAGVSDAAPAEGSDPGSTAPPEATTPEAATPDGGATPDQTGFQLVWYRNDQRQDARPVSIGQQFGGLTVTGIGETPRTVITLVRDPGARVALIGSIIMSVALVWYVVDRAVREDAA